MISFRHSQSKSVKIIHKIHFKNCGKCKKTVGRIVFCRGNRDDSSDSFYIFDLIHTNLCYCAMFLHIQSLFFTLLSVIHTIMNALLPLLKTFDRIFYVIRKNFNHLCIFRLIPYDTHFLKCLSGNITPQCHQYATMRYDQHIFRLPF